MPSTTDTPTIACRVLVGLLVFVLTPGVVGLVAGGWYWAVCGLVAVSLVVLLALAMMALVVVVEYVGFGGVPALVEEQRRARRGDA